ncbi:MAG: hypothetical protein KY433_07850 [Actinobacteria bacterium]|nr:hypothetical protein [Actinomycetota bacterium]
MLGSLSVLGQQAVALHGARSAIVLPLNPRVRAVVARPLVITAVALLLAGQVPDAGEPSHAVTAAVATLALATIGVLRYSATSLQGLYSGFTAPVVFGKQVLAGVRGHLERGHTGYVVFRAGLLTEMLGQAVQRGDSRSSTAALLAIDRLHEAYIAAAAKNSAARQHTYDDGHQVEAWFSHEIADGLVAAAVDALSASRATEGDIDGILDTIERMGERAIRAGHPEETEAAIVALLQIATCVQQVQPSGVINHPSRTLTTLAQIEAAAEEHGDCERATLAVAGMALELTYVQAWWKLENPVYAIALRLLGDDPPFYAAGEVLESREWNERWANKLPPLPVGILLLTSWIERMAHEHADQRGKQPPRATPADAPAWWMQGANREELARQMADFLGDDAPEHERKPSRVERRVSKRHGRG